MDKIFIEGLQAETIIGIFDWERHEKQLISIDLEMAADIAKAAKTDVVEDTLDYKRITKQLLNFIESSEFFLIETLAEQLAQLVMREFGVPWLKLRLSKPGALRDSDNVGVEIERGKRPN